MLAANGFTSDISTALFTNPSLDRKHQHRISNKFVLLMLVVASLALPATEDCQRCAANKAVRVSYTGRITIRFTASVCN